MADKATCSICGKRIESPAAEGRTVCDSCQTVAVSDRPIAPTDPARAPRAEDRIRAALPPEFNRSGACAIFFVFGTLGIIAFAIFALLVCSNINWQQP